jgi:menaquinol-cytochrome c reductase iron-sulfur subunit
MKEKSLGPKQDPTRRGLITGVLYAIPFLVGGTLAASVGNYLFGRQPDTRKDSWADAGDVSDVQVGAPCEIRFERVVVDGWKLRNEESSAWIILDDHRQVTAFSPLCTHLGCAYRWQAQKGIFSCPCHGSAFNVRGDVIAGPASRPLDRYSTKLEDNRLWLGPLQDPQGA